MRSIDLAKGTGYFLFCCFLFSLSGCVSLNNSVSDTLKASPLATKYEIQNVPFFPQLYDQCGPASLATVLNYRQVNTTPAELRDYVYLPEKGGSLQVEIVAKARREGKLVYPLGKSLENLLREVSENNPVLVLQNLRFDWWPQWHYSVVIGYDLSQNKIILRSGSEKHYKVNIELFYKTWLRTDKWAIVILNPADIPATAREFTYVKAAIDLEEIGRPVEAAQAYQAALNRWPENRLALFGLANHAHINGDYQQALQNYQQVLARYPNFTAGWNNYAYTLNAVGCKAVALESIHCALNQDSNSPELKASLEEIEASPAPLSSVNIACPEFSCPLYNQ